MVLLITRQHTLESLHALCVSVCRMCVYGKLLPRVSYISMQQWFPPQGFPFIIMQTGRGNKKYHWLDQLFIPTLTNVNGLTAITHYLSRENMWLRPFAAYSSWCGGVVCAFLTKDTNQTLEVCTCIACLPPSGTFSICRSLLFMKYASFLKGNSEAQKEQLIPEHAVQCHCWHPLLSWGRCRWVRWVTSCFLLPASK